MFPPKFRWTSLAILGTGLLSKRPLWVSAQQSTVVCLPQYNWMDNSKAQNPCLVAAYAQGVCNDGTFSVDPLPSTYHYYVGPSVGAENACKCNSITYNLVAACSICQNYSYINWSSWSTNCSMTYLAFPEDIPSGTAIPHWAYQDVSTSDRFNVTLAQLARDASESTAIKTQAIAIVVPLHSPTSAPSSSSTCTASLTSGGSNWPITQYPISAPSSSSTLTASLASGGSNGAITQSLTSAPSSSTSTLTALDIYSGSQETITQPPTSAPSSSSESPNGAIVGGVVGGVVEGFVGGMFVGIAAFIVWFCVRRRRQTELPSAMYDESILGGTVSPFLSPAPQLMVYDSSDPSTLPTSPATNYQNNSVHSNI